MVITPVLCLTTELQNAGAEMLKASSARETQVGKVTTQVKWEIIFRL